MHPLSDKDLDRLSREAAEQFDVDQSPSGWEHLETRLNKELPAEKEKRRRRFLWIFFLFLLLGGSSLVWLIAGRNDNGPVSNAPINNSKNKNSNVDDDKSSSQKTTPDTDNKSNRETNSNKLEEKNEPTNPKTENDKSSAVGTVKNESNNVAPQSNNTVTKQKNISSIAANKTSQPSATNSPGIPGKSGSVSNRTIIRSPFAVNKKSSRGKSRPTENETRKMAEEIVPNNNTTTTDLKKAEETNSVVAVPGNKSDEEKNSIAPNKTNAQTADSSQPATTTPPTLANINDKKKEPKRAIKQGPLAFGFVTGIDWSRISGTGDKRIGYNYGATISYNLGKRWSVNTGFIVTKKMYSAKAKDFSPPKHYWTYYVDLKSLEGDCEMWDIPLNIRYNITTNPSNTWFVNTGMSSYIMRKQAYTYDYLYNGVPTKSNWKTSSQQNEWFKILNVSAGYERALNKSWSVQAEPFMKIPLSGVGFGKMDMSSYGILVGIKYKPVFNKTKTTPASKIP